jgi:glucose/mannose-6-phosphate isomerase
MPELTLLDQPEEIEAIDKGGILKMCERMPHFGREAFEQAKRMAISLEKPHNIIIAGMGGSAIGGELLRSWLRDTSKTSISVSRSYTLPAYADDRSLVVAISYSGETEETLNSFLEAVERRCMVVTITSGGHLKRFSESLGVPCVTVPEGLVPRAAIAHMFFPLVFLMDRAGVVKETEEEVEESLRVLRKVSDENSPKTPLKNNKAKKLALALEGKIPIIYGFGQYRAVAQRLKCQFNENSKIPSYFEAFPELDHNEIVGWEAAKDITKHFALLILRDPKEPTEIKHRIEITKEIASAKVARILEIKAQGHRKLARLLSTMHLGDFASVYLALLRGVDPSQTISIDNLKREMKKRLNMLAILRKKAETMR